MALLVNGEPVDEALIRAEAAQLRVACEADLEELEPLERELRLRAWARENIIEQTLLRQEAAKDPAPIPPEEIQRVLRELHVPSSAQTGCGTQDLTGRTADLYRETEARLRVDRLVARVMSAVPPPRQRDIQAYYQQNRRDFMRPEMVHVAHIVKNAGEGTTAEDARAVLEQALQRLRAGEAFASVADELSDCRGNGGDLGYFPRGEMVEEFDEAVFALPVGTTSDIFSTRFGLHVARLLDRRREGIPPLAEVQEAIAYGMLQHRQEEAANVFLTQLRQKAEIRETSRREK